MAFPRQKGITSSNLTEDAFTKAENGMKFTPAGNAGYSLDLHGPSSGKLASGRVQTPAQHASVKRAAQVSVAKRKARMGFKGLKGL